MRMFSYLHSHPFFRISDIYRFSDADADVDGFWIFQVYIDNPNLLKAFVNLSINYHSLIHFLAYKLTMHHAPIETFERFLDNIGTHTQNLLSTSRLEGGSL